MQPMMMLTCRQAGIVRLNGSFAGETRADEALFRPVCAYGAAILEFVPYSDGFLPMARRIAFSAGKPVKASVSETEGISVISWPFGMTEAELRPSRVCAPDPEIRKISGSGRNMRMFFSEDRAYMEIDAAAKTFSYDLPAGAEMPLVAENDGQTIVSGEIRDGGRYALVLSPEADKLLLSVRGNEIAFLGNRRIAVAEDAGDIAGHVRRTVYFGTGSGYQAEETELLPNPNGTFQPQTPLDCAIMAAEAFMMNRKEEESACFLNGTDMSDSAKEVLSKADSVTALRFPVPDGRPAFAALQREADNFAVAYPVYFTCDMYNGAWKLTGMYASEKEQ